MEIHLVSFIVAYLVSHTTALYSMHTDYQYPFQDPSLAWNDRVEDLVGRLTLEEIVAQSMAVYGTTVPAIPRLGINPYVWQTECLRGQAHTKATAFPQALGLAASFSSDLMYNISEAIAMEVRAHWNDNVKHGVYKTFYGLSCFSPVINIVRHPLWGRIQETYGEDPFLTGSLSQQFVQGLQGNDARYIRANAGCKHFDVYAGPEDIPVQRHKFDAKVSMTDWRMTFMPAFKMCIESGTYNIMCSYNSVNGIPACVHKYLLTDVLRTEWGFTGYVVSDANAITDVIKNHKYINNTVDTVAAAIKAGCNLELASTVYNSTLEAMKQGKLTEQQIRDNIKPLWYTRMRHGEFDPPSMNPYTNITMEVIQSEAHRYLATKAATQSFVLLKNEKNILPIKSQVDKVTMVGPMADNAQALFGNYAADLNPKYTKTPWDTLKQLGKEAVLAEGCAKPKCPGFDFDDIKKKIVGSDLIIICLGTGDSIESEGMDRKNLNLPGKQLELLKGVTDLANGAPIILLLFNAGPLDISWAKYNDSIHAIMECFLPAQATGDALYQVITSQNGAVPAGRLPLTWPVNMTQVPAMTDYTMIGRTYRYFKGEPLYPFGYGLSYTSFTYNNILLSNKTIHVGDELKFSVTVQNTGSLDGDEVVQAYLRWEDVTLPAPNLQLIAFRRIHIKAKASSLQSFTITSQQMALWIDKLSAFKVTPGGMDLYVGGQQPFQKTKISSNVLTADFTITSL